VRIQQLLNPGMLASNSVGIHSNMSVIYFSHGQVTVIVARNLRPVNQIAEDLRMKRY
jgi:hypothetical protein